MRISILNWTGVIACKVFKLLVLRKEFIIGIYSWGKTNLLGIAANLWAAYKPDFSANLELYSKFQLMYYVERKQPTTKA